MLHLPPIDSKAKYLGISMSLTRHKVQDFRYIISQVQNRLQGWKSKLLSWGGRATPISSVIEGIPNYTMSILKGPQSICSQLDQLSRRFWWNPIGEKSHYFTPLSWEKLCYPKKIGRSWV